MKGKRIKNFVFYTYLIAGVYLLYIWAVMGEILQIDLNCCPPHKVASNIFNMPIRIEDIYPYIYSIYLCILLILIITFKKWWFLIVLVFFALFGLFWMALGHVFDGNFFG